MYDELKKRILLKAGIAFPTPNDCKLISENIYQITNRRVSETTLKRLLGFAVMRHKFSSYTISSLSEYADSSCQIILNTKVNSAFKKSAHDKGITLKLKDGHIRSSNCNDEIKVEQFNDEEIPIKIKLSNKQVKEVLSAIKKRNE